MSIQIKQVEKTFGSFHALKSIDLTVEKGALVALLGPSGSGKTTLLRIIAGLESANSGEILFDEVNVTAKTIKERKVGFVFQHYALFRHMTIYENIAFGLEVQKKATKEEISARVRELLALVQLEGLEQRLPSQLSGGQQQRVALARALAVEPEVLLLDEPFGALDAKVRQELRTWLKALLRRLNITTIFVTHDQDEALELADTVVVMSKGQIEQVGQPHEVYHAPETPFVFSFLGRVNEIARQAEHGVVQIGAHEWNLDGEAIGYIRPHEVKVVKTRHANDQLRATITDIYNVGPTVRLTLDVERLHEELEAELSLETFFKLDVRRGDHVYVDLQQLRLYSDGELLSDRHERKVVALQK